MIIHVLSNYFRLNWLIINADEKHYLKRKFKQIKLKQVKIILQKSKAEIEVIAVDEGTAFIHWPKEHLPSAQIVFDRFHTIKQMSEKRDFVSRRIAAKLDSEERNVLTNQHFTLLRNKEDLNSAASSYRSKIKHFSQGLADIHMLKEVLRSISPLRQMLLIQNAHCFGRKRPHSKSNPINCTKQQRSYCSIGMEF